MTGTLAKGLFQGHLDVIRQDILHGWLFSAAAAAKPLVIAGGTPAALLDDNIPRPDVNAALGVADAFGFAVRLPRMQQNDTVTLYAVTPQAVVPVVKSAVTVPVCERRFLSQLQRAVAIAKEPDAVAVVCWDGGHNPLGRAKILYDVAASKRPAALFCYLREEFGDALWPPLRNSDLPIVTIPWKHRHFCHALLRSTGLTFDTVWICKPRLPSFRLASVISGPETKFLLDMDDDEEAFISVQPDPAEYNMPGLGLARELTAGIASRTVVSPTLQQRYGGVLLRHARSPYAAGPHTPQETRKVAFIGTVREHKGILPLARALLIFSNASGIPLEFHLWGDVQPPELREALNANGVILGEPLPMRNLQATLAAMDVVVTSFPMDDALSSRISHMQVPAKISDALSVGIPVLTPDTPAIADIRDLPGVYPFTLKTFHAQLLAALQHTGPIPLPEEFTLQGAYAAFAEAEQKAEPSPLLHCLLPPPEPLPDAPPALLLLWKQHDAGLYGRRVDQLARSYARQYPDHRVFVLELLVEQCEPQNTEEESDETPVPDIEPEAFTDEAAAVEHLLSKKRLGWRHDGALYQTLAYSERYSLREALLSFLETNALTPWNTVVVLFPIIQDYRYIEDMLQPYTTVVDVVDNQLGWAGTDERRCFVNEQYFRLMQSHAHIVFNAERNRDYFAKRGFLGAGSSVHVIPNWYSFPDGATSAWKPYSDSVLRVFYSGNMNDRIDWPLLHDLARQPNVRLHLAGTVARALPEFTELAALGNVVYHGVTSEKETLALLCTMDVALIPHTQDAISEYMDPMKLKMYAAVGIPVICPGHLEATGSNVHTYEDRGECLTLCSMLADREEKVEESTVAQAEPRAASAGKAE